jgi:hypothetical protein
MQNINNMQPNMLTREACSPAGRQLPWRFWEPFLAGSSEVRFQYHYESYNSTKSRRQAVKCETRVWLTDNQYVEYSKYAKYAKYAPAQAFTFLDQRHCLFTIVKVHIDSVDAAHMTNCAV